MPTEKNSFVQAGKTILILGGGVGGLVTANQLRKRLGREHPIVLVDKSGQHLFSASLPWAMVGWRRPEELSKDLRRMVHPDVEVIQAEVQAIDPKKQIVMTGAGDLDFDYLVVAMGAELAPEVVPGYAEAAHNIFSLDGVTSLANALKAFSRGRVVVVISKLPYKCPAAPYEVALLLRDFFRHRRLLGQLDIQIFTPESLPMPSAGPVMGQTVKGMLEERDIGFHPNIQLESIDPDRRELKFKDGATSSFDLLAAVPPHCAPKALEGSGLTNEAGWVPVDRRTLRTKFKNIYAIGDVTTITLSNGKPLPKAGVFAHAEAKVVANLIATDILRTESEIGFDGLGYCWIEMGGGVAGFAGGDFYAEPEPVVKLHRPGRMWHLGKVLFERYWMHDGLYRIASQWALVLGSKLFKVPASL